MGDFFPSFGAEFLGSGLATLSSASTAKGYGMRISAVNGLFQRTSIHPFANCMLYHLAGNLHEIPFLAGTFGHGNIMPRIHYRRESLWKR